MGKIAGNWYLGVNDGKEYRRTTRYYVQCTMYYVSYYVGRYHPLAKVYSFVLLFFGGGGGGGRQLSQNDRELLYLEGMVTKYSWLK